MPDNHSPIVMQVSFVCGADDIVLGIDTGRSDSRPMAFGPEREPTPWVRMKADTTDLLNVAPSHP